MADPDIPSTLINGRISLKDQCAQISRHRRKIQLALLRAGFVNCVFMWALLGFDPKPTVRQFRATPDPNNSA